MRLYSFTINCHATCCYNTEFHAVARDVRQARRIVLKYFKDNMHLISPDTRKATLEAFAEWLQASRPAMVPAGGCRHSVDYDGQEGG